jgi:hypothetical protein
MGEEKTNQPRKTASRYGWKQENENDEYEYYDEYTIIIRPRKTTQRAQHQSSPAASLRRPVRSE